MVSIKTQGAAIVAAIALAGCAQTGQLIAKGMGVQPLQSTTQVTGSQFEPASTVTGIERNLCTGQASCRYSLRSFVPKNGARASHQLYVDVFYTGNWAFFESASADAATPLTFTTVGTSDVDCSSACLYQETFGAAIPDSTLRARSAGYAVKFYARNGQTLTVPLDSVQIHAQLRVVDSLAAVRAR